MAKMICFDMDGTIADLYGVDGWLEMLRAEDDFPYYAAEPLVDMARLSELITALQDIGYEINVITWNAKEASKEYAARVRAAKKNWLAAHGFHYDHFHCVKYGTPKTVPVRSRMGDDELCALIDDDEWAAALWFCTYRNVGDFREWIDPNETPILEFLEKLLDRE